MNKTNFFKIAFKKYKHKYKWSIKKYKYENNYILIMYDDTVFINFLK